MKALSIHPFFAMGIATGEKTIEVRTWKTDYRGEIVICSTKKKLYATIAGHALCTVKITDCVPFTRKMCEDALLNTSDWQPGLYAWILDDNRLIEPVPVKGKLSLWNYDGPINYIPEGEWVYDENDPDKSAGWYDKYWRPLLTGV